MTPGHITALYVTAFIMKLLFFMHSWVPRKGDLKKRVKSRFIKLKYVPNLSGKILNSLCTFLKPSLTLMSEKHAESESR